MSGLDRSNISGGGGDPNPGRGPQFDGYPRPAQPRSNGDRGLSTNGSDGSAAANDNTNGKSTLDPTELEFLQRWKVNATAIGNANIKIGQANDPTGKDQGAHLQNAVYDYTNKVLKEMGLDKEGWSAYPSVMGSPLDDIGGDIALINNKTGAIALLDPTSRRLDPKTGERVSESASAKKNMPAIREPGVIDALPRWFERGSGALDEDQGNPAMNQRVQDFKSDFRTQLSDLTSNPPFNLKDFPLPHYNKIDGKDGKAESVNQINKVIDWSKQKAQEARRQGDGHRADLLQDYSNKLNPSRDYNKRTESPALEASMKRTVNRVLADEVLRRAYPNLYPSDNDTPRKVKTLDDGSSIRADNSGNLVVDLKDASKPRDPAAKDVYTGGSISDAFRDATSYWITARGNPQKEAEFKALLPKDVVRRIDNKEINLDKLLSQFGADRQALSAGGAGVEQPMIGRAVARMATLKADGLHKLVEGAATEVTAPVERAPAPVPPIKASDATRRPPETNHGRPSASGNGEWNPGQAPTPKIGKVDLPKDAPVNGAAVKAAEQGERPLEPVELELIQEQAQMLEAKGRANLSPSESEMLASWKYAERELGKPLGNDPVKCGIVRQLREMWGGNEAKGPLLTVGMLSVIVLNFYQSHKNDPQDDSRAKFY